MEIPGYTIIRELSKSGIATVYLAIQDRLNRQVVLKIIKPVLGEDDQFANRFIKEGRIVLQLKHPQIISLYDLNSYDFYYYFSMEFLPGGTLSQHIEHGLTTEHALTIIKLIANALAYAHNQGIIHRNIKSKNILFRQDGTPVLSDFSIAKVLDVDVTQLTTVGIIIDNPIYMSPEQMNGQPLDARSDLYSLGIVFYEMLTQRLFPKAIDYTFINPVRDHFTLPAYLDKFQPVLDKFLAKNPEDRFASAEHVIEAIEQIEIDHDTDSKLERRLLPIVSSASPLTSSITDTSRTLKLQPSPSTPTVSSVVITPETSIGKLRYSKTALIVSSVSVLSIVAMIGSYLLMTHQLPYSGFKPNAQLPSVLDNRSAAAIHYEQLAMGYFQRDEWEASLESIRFGLNVAPKDDRLLALRDQVQAHQQAAQFLAQAQERQQQGALEESLKLIEQGLQQVPEQADLLKLRDQVEVHAKLEQIANQYVDGAKNALAQDDLDKVENYLEQLSKIQPDHPKLSVLRQALQAKRDRIAAVQRQMEETAHRQAAEELKRRMDAEAKRQAIEEARHKATERAHRPTVEVPKRQAAVSETADNNHRHCGNILSRLTLGEPVSNEDRTFLTRCR